MSDVSIAASETAGSEAMPPTAPKLSEFNFPDFYRAAVDREHMQVAKDEVRWTEMHGAPDRDVDVLLNFGCNARQTPHLMREAVAVFETLGIDFAAVAGQQYCCGKPYSVNGLHDAARGVVVASVRRMASYRPRRAIQWCSACEMQFHDLVVPELGIEFHSDGLAAFLTQKLDALGDRVPWRDDVHIRAAVHGHLGQHAVRDAHPSIAMDLLRRIPGVEVVGFAEMPALEICGNGELKSTPVNSEQYRATQRRLERDLAALSADTLVTLYHGCTRELGKFAGGGLRVRHYISVIAAALGVSKPDRFSEYWRLGDGQKVKEASRRNWESWGISEDDALRLAHKYFTPKHAEDQPECPCNGECTRTGPNWETPRRVSRDKELPVIRSGATFS